MREGCGGVTCRLLGENVWRSCATEHDAERVDIVRAQGLRIQVVELGLGEGEQVTCTRDARAVSSWPDPSLPSNARAHRGMHAATVFHVPCGAAFLNGLKDLVGSGSPSAILDGSGGPGRLASDTTAGSATLGATTTSGKYEGVMLVCEPAP